MTVSIIFCCFDVKNVGPLHTIVYWNISPVCVGVYLTCTSKGVGNEPLAVA